MNRFATTADGAEFRLEVKCTKVAVIPYVIVNGPITETQNSISTLVMTYSINQTLLISVMTLFSATLVTQNRM